MSTLLRLFALNKVPDCISLRCWLHIYFFSIICIGAQFIESPLPLPEVYVYHASAIYNDELILFSGSRDVHLINYRSYQHSIPLSNAFESSGIWTKKTYINPLNITEMEIHEEYVQIDNLIYIINPETYGGSAIDGHEMFIYNLDSNTFTVSDDWPTYPGYHGCAVYDVIDNRIYHYGGKYYKIAKNGKISTIYSNLLQVFDIETSAWTQGESVPQRKYLTGCEIDTNNRRIYDFGGSQYSTAVLGLIYTDAIHRYDIDTDRWTELTATLSGARDKLVCRYFPYDENIYCLGGSDLLGFDVVDVFNPFTEQMVTTLSLNTPRELFTANVWHNNCLIIAGGWNDIAANDEAPVYSVEYFGHCVANTSVSVQSSTEAPVNNLPSTTADETTKATVVTETSHSTFAHTSNSAEHGISIETTMFLPRSTVLGTISAIGAEPSQFGESIAFIIGIIVGVLVPTMAAVAYKCYHFYKNNKSSQNEQRIADNVVSNEPQINQNQQAEGLPNEAPVEEGDEGKTWEQNTNQKERDESCTISHDIEAQTGETATGGDAVQIKLPPRDRTKGEWM